MARHAVTQEQPWIRRAEPRDLTQLVQLCADHAVYERTTFDPTGKRERLEHALFSRVPRLYAWVVVQGEVLVGYATATIDYSTWDAAPFAYLDCLYLCPQIRRRGVGVQLLEEVKTLGKLNGCGNVQWQTPHWNEDAIRFYHRQGAHSTSKCRLVLPLVD